MKGRGGARLHGGVSQIHQRPGRPEIKLQIFPPPLLNQRRPDLEEHR